MIQGNCLCGGIEIEAQEIPGMVFNCHCSRCRRAHGAAFSTQVILEPGSLSFTKGEELLKKYEFEGIVRAFCSACGSRLLNYSTRDTGYMSASLSAINNRPELKPAAECFAPERLAYVQLDSSIPHFAELPGERLS